MLQEKLALTIGQLVSHRELTSASIRPVIRHAQHERCSSGTQHRSPSVAFQLRIYCHADAERQGGASGVIPAAAAAAQQHAKVDSRAVAAEGRQRQQRLRPRALPRDGIAAHHLTPCARPCSGIMRNTNQRVYVH